MRKETGADRMQASDEIPGSTPSDLTLSCETEVSTASAPRAAVHPVAPWSVVGRKNGVPACSRVPAGKKASRQQITRITVSPPLVFYTPYGTCYTALLADFPLPGQLREGPRLPARSQAPGCARVPDYVPEPQGQSPVAARKHRRYLLHAGPGQILEPQRYAAGHQPSSAHGSDRPRGGARRFRSGNGSRAARASAHSGHGRDHHAILS